MTPGGQRGPDQRLAENVRFFRDLKKMSQADLARLMKERGHQVWHQQTVAATESGERPARWAEVLSLAEIFGVHVDRLDAFTGEAAEAEMLYQRGARVRITARELSRAVTIFLAAVAHAELGLAKPPEHATQRVEAARDAVEDAVSECTLDGAVQAGIDAYEAVPEGEAG